MLALSLDVKGSQIKIKAIAKRSVTVDAHCSLGRILSFHIALIMDMHKSAEGLGLVDTTVYNERFIWFVMRDAQLQTCGTLSEGMSKSPSYTHFWL